MKILALETSCDETAVAIIEDGQKILSNLVASQIEDHKRYGGIVPEIASRKHVEILTPMIEHALQVAKINFSDLEAVAVTYGPGLVGALLVGISAAKAIAYALKIPLIGVNHVEAHIYANFLTPSPTTGGIHPSPSEMERGIKGVRFPFVCLIVSGGHTQLILAHDHGKYELLGRTRDDAAGEAFDKVARFLELGYPGGPVIDKLAKEGNPKAIAFPRAMLEEGYDFSFSGLKTAVINYVMRESVAVAPGETSNVERSTVRTTPSINARRIPDIVASFQQAIVDVLVEKTLRAAREKKVKTIALAGGVSANSSLRKELSEKALKEGLEVIIPPLNLCTDNAAMIGSCGYYKLKRGEFSDFSLTAVSTLRIG